MSSGGQRVNLLERRWPFVFSLLLSFCLIFGGAFIVGYHSYKRAKEAAIGSNATRAALVAKLILGHQRAAVGVLESYSRRPLLIEAVKRKDFDGALRHLTDLAKNNPEVEWPYIANPDSTVWVNFPVDKGVFNKDLSGRDWYRGVSKEWRPYISNVYRMVVGEKDLAVTVSVPIFDEKGKVVGILAGAQSTARFRKLIDEVSSSPDVDMTLIDREGRIICSNRLPYTKEVIEYPPLDFVGRAKKGEKGEVEIQGSSDGSRGKYVSFAPIEGVGWSILFEKGQDEVLRSEYSSFALIAAVSFLVFAVLVLSLVYLRARQRQIRSLKEVNEELNRRVRERTAELEMTNQSLNAEISERKRAEEEIRRSRNELEIRVQERTEELARSRERLQLLASQLLLAQENERKRVAVELHDGLMSELAATKFLLEGKIMLLDNGNPIHPGELRRIADILAGTMKEARRLMNNLHPSVLDELGLIAAIGWLCGEYQKFYPNISVQKEIAVSERDISESLRVVIYRVLQESLNNFARHGKGDRVEVSLAKSAGTFSFVIRDNGRGFDLDHVEKGLGLESMRERVELSGGEFQIESIIGRGTTIRANWNRS